MKKAIVFLLSLCLIITIISVDAGAATKKSDVVILINGESFAPSAPMVIKVALPMSFKSIREVIEPRANNMGQRNEDSNGKRRKP